MNLLDSIEPCDRKAHLATGSELTGTVLVVLPV
jgi:hypothetical protein